MSGIVDLHCDTISEIYWRRKERDISLKENNLMIDIVKLRKSNVMMQCFAIFTYLKKVKNPFMASHSNARGVCNHARNLSDDIIKKMANKGCIAGLNYYPDFFSTNFSHRDKKAYVEDAIKMLKYMVNTGGSEFAALGSDYDGFHEKLEWEDAGGTGMLIDEMKKAGFKSSLIDNILYKNALRIFKEVV